MQDNVIRDRWYRRRLVWVLVVTAAVFLMTFLLSNNPEKHQTTKEAAQSSSDDMKQTDVSVKTAPRFADYISKPMTDVAKEFGLTYDSANSTQISVEKDGYKLQFEDGGRITDVAKENTGMVNIAYIELSSMGKCEQSQVYSKIDEAMQLTGLNPNDKGAKHEGMGGTLLGYGAYRNYKGDQALELALLCDYDRDDYKLQLRILPDYR